MSYHQRYLPQGPPPMQPLLATEPVDDSVQDEALYEQYHDQPLPHSQTTTHSYSSSHDYDHRREYTQPPPPPAQPTQPPQYHGTYRTPVSNYPRPDPPRPSVHDSPHYPSTAPLPAQPSPPPPIPTTPTQPPPNIPSASPPEMPIPAQPVESGQYATLPPPTSYYPPSTFGSLARPPIGAPAPSAGYTDQDGKWQTYPADQHGLVMPSGTPPGGFGAVMGQTHNGIDDGDLNSLSDAPPDANGNPCKPPYPYTTIIRYAIQGSPRNKLTLSELYASMEARFPWYKSADAGNGWRNSVRHNLSLSKCFVKVSRPITEPGKGSYWTLDLTAGEGKSRTRKRSSKRKRSVEEDAVPAIQPVLATSQPAPLSNGGGAAAIGGSQGAPSAPVPRPVDELIRFREEHARRQAQEHGYSLEDPEEQHYREDGEENSTWQGLNASDEFHSADSSVNSIDLSPVMHNRNGGVSHSQSTTHSTHSQQPSSQGYPTSSQQSKDTDHGRYAGSSSPGPYNDSPHAQHPYLPNTRQAHPSSPPPHHHPNGHGPYPPSRAPRTPPRKRRPEAVSESPNGRYAPQYTSNAGHSRPGSSSSGIGINGPEAKRARVR